MEAWRKVFREGFLPGLPGKGLEALKLALESDDPRLIQGATTSPPPWQGVQDWAVEAACPVALCGVATMGGFGEATDGIAKAEGNCQVAEAEEFFAKACFEADQRLGEAAACRWFLNFWDETPRHEARRLLLEEVKLALAEQRVG